MAKVDGEAQALIDEYLDSLEVKTKIEERLKQAKEKLLAYSRKISKKTIKGHEVSLTVSVKHRTVFPKLNQPGRKELEQTVRDAGFWNEALSFDVLKLAEAYDDNRLPEDLKEKLSPFSRKEDLVKVYVIEQRSNL